MNTNPPHSWNHQHSDHSPTDRRWCAPTVADFMNGLLLGGGDGSNPARQPEPAGDGRWRWIHVVAVGAVPAPTRRDAELVRLLSRTEGGRAIATLRFFETTTTAPIQTTVAVARVTEAASRAIWHDHSRGLYPWIKSIHISREPLAIPVRDNAGSDRLRIEIEHDAAPVMSIIYDKIVALLGEDYDIASRAHAPDQATIEIAFPVASPALADRLASATDQLSALMEQLHAELGFRTVLYLQEADAIILRVIKRIA